jgi:hypothetical protein
MSAAVQAFEPVWRSAVGRARENLRLGPRVALEDFLGHPADPAAYRLVGVHHTAVYIGDYVHEDEVEAWAASLEDRLRAGELTRYERGPSWIAPRHYGTPGWWFSVDTADGLTLEAFCCRVWGRWAELPVETRQVLMSHVGLATVNASAVRSALDQLVQREALEAIAFTSEDELGHTYGHLRDPRTHRVLEVVFDPRGEA